MSLGTPIPWKARLQRIGVSGISLTPRGPRRWPQASSAQLSPSRRWIHAASDATQDKPDEGITSHRGTNLESTIRLANHDIRAQGSGEQSNGDAASPPPGRWTDKEEAKGVDRAFEAGATEMQLSKPTGKSTMTITHGQRSAGDTQPSTPATEAIPTEDIQQPLRIRKVHNVTQLKHGSQGEKVQPKNVKNTQKTIMTPTQYDSVLVTPAVRYNSSREAQSSLQRTSQSVTRQLRLQAIRQIQNQPLINWRATLDILRLQTRPLRGPWQIRARKISVEPELGDKLLYEVDHTIWDIHEQTRCHIELHWPKDAYGRASNDGIYLLLSGDEEALEHAAEEIYRIAVRNKSTISTEGAIGGKFIGSQVSSAKPEEPARSTAELLWESSVESQRPGYTPEYTAYQPHHKIPKPQEWTPQTFLAYVTAITNARLPERLSSKFYGSGTTAIQAAIALLKAAFADKTTSKAHSRRAFKQALRLIELHGHSHRNEAREFFNNRLKLNLPPVDTDTFNILLTGNVKVKDLFNFDSILKLMIRHRCLPNAQTWSLFLQLIESEEIRRHVVQIMHSLGLLLDPTAVKLIAKELVVYDVRHAHDKWPGMREFLQSQDAKYGKHWVSKAAMIRIMNELGRLGNLSSCLDLFDIMSELSLTTPTTIVLDIVLYHARMQRKFAISTAILRKASKLNIAFDEQTYHELFSMAFRMRRPNALGLIWRYACVDGKTSWYMRNDVSRLMKHGHRGQKGKADGEETAADVLALPSFCPRDMKLSGSKNAGAQIARRMHEQFKEWRPNEPLHEALNASWEDDSRIIQAVKQAKQQGQLSRKITVPGKPMLLHPRDRKLNIDPSQRLRLDMIITHLDPVDGDRAAIPDE
ncbi:pentatricopeptide repeat domain-containing protein [Colletotrichum zoysiae]|uniref:Pentatricopeptide repeat domain-containing protein n=1 Tax=Colletotrichum zoysiae TaxID=1216348 RepID=A0AAD9HU81_9PEZI|nr:pentatricopeptide repeat domain-containing protein [Colletotrichum zoysiae]